MAISAAPLARGDTRGGHHLMVRCRTMAFSFGTRSKNALATCHPALQAVAYRALELSIVDFTVTEGHRGREAQEAAFASGHSKAHFGQSSHNFDPSRALDVVPYPIDWEDTSKFKAIATAFKQAANELGVILRWGGDFKSITDFPHFEIDLPAAGWTPTLKKTLSSPSAPTQAGHLSERSELETLPATELLARVIWGECRGVDQIEARAIAHVVVNRAAKPGWWGRDVKSVCLKAGQFSCLNPGDPNLPKILSGVFSDGNWTNCLREASDAISGASEDPTNGAVSYHAASMHTYPAWSYEMHKTVNIGSHIFYKL